MRKYEADSDSFNVCYSCHGNSPIKKNSKYLLSET